LKNIIFNLENNEKKKRKKWKGREGKDINDKMKYIVTD